MKRIVMITLMIYSGITVSLVGQDSEPISRMPGIGMNFLAAPCLGEFRETYQKDLLFGFNFEATFIPFKKIKFWNLGGQFEAFINAKNKDDYHGVELITQNVFLRLNMVNKIQPYRDMKVKPFFVIDYGFNVSSTSSSYEIVDEASFLEKFLLNEEDVVVNETVMKHSDFNYNISLGVGLVFNELLSISCKYNYVPETTYVKKDGVYIDNGELKYKYSASAIKLLVVGIGISVSSRKMNDYNKNKEIQ